MIDTQNEESRKLSRRAFAVGTAAAVVGIAFNFRNGTNAVEAKSGAPKEVNLVEFSDTGQRGETVTGKRRLCGRLQIEERMRLGQGQRRRKQGCRKQ